jgi:hypothetical protein
MVGMLQPRLRVKLIADGSALLPTAWVEGRRSIDRRWRTAYDLDGLL